MNAQHHVGGKRCSACLSRRRTRRNQGQQPIPRDHQVHLIQKLTLARALADQLESRVSKTYLLHRCIVSDGIAEGLISGAI